MNPQKDNKQSTLKDTGERIIPTEKDEISLVYTRHRFAYEYAAGFVAGKTVLDVGCGTGYGCKLLAERAAKVVGVDHDGSAIEYCRQQFTAANIEYLCMDGNALDLREKFDVAVTFQAIEHMRDVGAFLEQLQDVVKVGGLIIITTPNVRTPGPQERHNPFHFNEMNYDQFRDALSQHFDTFKVLGVGYASPNMLRKWLTKTHLYRLGRVLKRGSRLKKVAAQTMALTNFKIIEANVTEEAADLMGLCTNTTRSQARTR